MDNSYYKTRTCIKLYNDDIDYLCKFDKNKKSNFYGVVKTSGNHLLKINGNFNNNLMDLNLKYLSLISFKSKLPKSVVVVNFGENIKKISLHDYTKDITCENKNIKNKKTINKKYFYLGLGRIRDITFEEKHKLYESLGVTGYSYTRTGHIIKYGANSSHFSS